MFPVISPTTLSNSLILREFCFVFVESRSPTYKILSSTDSLLFSFHFDDIYLFGLIAVAKTLHTMVNEKSIFIAVL